MPTTRETQPSKSEDRRDAGLVEILAAALASWFARPDSAGVGPDSARERGRVGLTSGRRRAVMVKRKKAAKTP